MSNININYISIEYDERNDIAVITGWDKQIGRHDDDDDFDDDECYDDDQYLDREITY